MNDKIDQAARALVASYTGAGVKIHHLDRQPLPSHAETIRVLATIHELLFPGYVGTQGLTGTDLSLRVEARMDWLYEALTEQIERAINHGQKLNTACTVTEIEAAECAAEFLSRLPDLRQTLASDVQAAYDGDPAAVCLDEIIFSYPGIYAVMVYRLAHELFKLRVPLIPRIMTEHAHSLTGIDIHPGAAIGASFFIDHGTGVVIGETCTIGTHCVLYHGVTLGAWNPLMKGDDGDLKRGGSNKRHPDLEDHVTVYPGATILGGATRIGHHSVIGGNVWLTHAVAPHSVVTIKDPELDIRTRKHAG